MAFKSSGELDRQIEIRSKSTTPGMGGDLVEGFATVYATVWAKTSPVGAGEGVVGDERTSSSRIMFSIRYIAGIKPEMKIYHEGNLWDIKSIQEPGKVQRRSQLEIVAEFENASPGST